MAVREGLLELHGKILRHFHFAKEKYGLFLCLASSIEEVGKLEGLLLLGCSSICLFVKHHTFLISKISQYPFELRTLKLHELIAACPCKPHIKFC